MQKCTYHSLEPSGMTVAILGKCKECGTETSYPSIVRCRECSIKSNLCMKCDESLEYSVEKAKAALDKLKDKELRREFQKTEENYKGFEKIHQGLCDGKYSNFSDLKADYAVLSQSIEKQMCEHMRKLFNL